MFCSVVVLNPAEENRRVSNRLNALESYASKAEASFWSNREGGHTLALLQDRVAQVVTLVDRCQRALVRVHDALFPLNPLPEGLHNLLLKFRDGLRVHKFVHAQLVGGARTALAWVKARHHWVILKDVAQGPPPDSRGQPRKMDPYYEVALEPAKEIIKRVDEETLKLRRQSGRDVPEMRDVPEEQICA